MATGNKTGGRQKGTPNKLTYPTRQLLVNALANEFDNLPELLEKLEPNQRIDAICKLSKFALPQMATIAAGIAERRSLEIAL
jgi:hypothetical protein